MAKTESGKSSKTSERRSPKKKEGSPALQAKDEGSEESKFNPRMREAYLQKVVPALMKEFGYKNIMQVPKLERIVLNVGMGEAIQNVKLLESAAGELGAITGQKPLITKAKKAIASFKLRQGMPIGTKVTLRSRRMWEFFDRLVTLSFDGRGNYTLGLKEQLIFPEIKYDEVASIHGMDITIVTTARTNDEGRALLKHLGMPFRT
jgi:large subunit ribosomal protein L5